MPNREDREVHGDTPEDSLNTDQELAAVDPDALMAAVEAETPDLPEDAAASAEPESADSEVTEESGEAVLAPRIHPSAARGVTEEDLAEGRAEHGQFYIGLWGQGEHAKPIFGCPYCHYNVLKEGDLDANGDIELHILKKIDMGSVPHQAALVVEEE